MSLFPLRLSAAAHNSYAPLTPPHAPLTTPLPRHLSHRHHQPPTRLSPHVLFTTASFAAPACSPSSVFHTHTHNHSLTLRPSRYTRCYPLAPFLLSFTHTHTRSLTMGPSPTLYCDHTLSHTLRPHTLSRAVTETRHTQTHTDPRIERGTEVRMRVTGREEAEGEREVRETEQERDVGGTETRMVGE